MTNDAATRRIATYCAQNAIEAGPASMFGTPAMALASARAEFAAARHAYASGGFNGALAAEIIAAAFAA